MAIHFFFNNTSIKLAERRKLKIFLASLFEQHKIILSSLSYIFCNDQYLLAINQEFLSHNDYTDIITFTLSEPKQPLEGEIYISAERLKYNTKKFGTTINEEMHRIIFHGALHLCGYRDKNRSDKANMTAAENKYLELYFKKHQV